MYRSEVAADADYGGRLLHMTFCAPELTAPTYYQPLVASGAAEFITLAGSQPLRGLAFSSHIVPHESHASGFGPAHASFLRTAYSARG
jgi:hypothetical protein